MKNYKNKVCHLLTQFPFSGLAFRWLSEWKVEESFEDSEILRLANDQSDHSCEIQNQKENVCSFEEQAHI
jgi:hypothetical protein